MKIRTRNRFSIPILFSLTLILCGVFPSPVIAVEQVRPDMVLRIHDLAPALKVADDIAGATGMQISPSFLLGGLLQGTAWIDSSRDIVLGAWFDPAHPEADPILGALVPYTYENSGFATTYHAEVRKGYYLIPLQPGNQAPLTAAFESALAGESTTTSRRFLSMEISLSQILKNSDARIKKWTAELEKKMPPQQGSPSSIKPEQAKKMIAGFVDLGKQVKRLAVGIDLNSSEVSFFMAVKGEDGSKLNDQLTQKSKPGQSRLVNLVLPGNFSVLFKTRRYSSKALTGFLNDSLGEFYRSIGIDLSQAETITKYFTGETSGGIMVKKDSGFDLAVASVLDESARQNPDFLNAVYIPWIMDYTKKIISASRDLNPGTSEIPSFSRSAQSKVFGQPVYGITALLPMRSATGAPVKKVSVSIRMAAMDGLLLAASDDNMLGKLINAARNLKPGPDSGPLFEARMRTADWTGTASRVNKGDSSGEVVITADIRNGELVIEDKVRVADIKQFAAAAMKAPQQQKPPIGMQGRPKVEVTKKVSPKKKVITPDMPEYWINKGSLYSSYGNETAAVRAFKKALELDSGDVEAEFKIGVSYGALQEYDMALMHINRAMDGSPENGRYQYGRAWIYLLSGRTAEAMNDMKAAAEMGNPDALGYLELHSEGGR